VKVGAAAAYLQSGVFFGGRYWLLLGSSVLVITWLNLRFVNLNADLKVQGLGVTWAFSKAWGVFFVCSNDAYDAETGVDKNKKESVVNITGR
jgi:hypothetical protein